MEQFDRYLDSAREKGIDHAVVIETSRVYTAPWVRMKCQYGCRFYNNSLCCPPRTPKPEEMREILDSYSHAILLHKLWKRGVRDIRSFNEAVVAVELALFFDTIKRGGWVPVPAKSAKSATFRGGAKIVTERDHRWRLAELMFLEQQQKMA
jgi:predicted metal-binding protein